MSFLKVKEESITKSDMLKSFIKEIDLNQNFLGVVDLLMREVWLTNITPIVADEIDRLIRFWNDVDEVEGSVMEGRKPIKIFIDCYGGGSLTAMFTIIDTIKMSKTPVYTINVGATYKEALYVYLAGHKRYSYPRATFLFKKDLKPFDVDDNPQSNYNNFCEKQILELKDMLFDKTKITENEYEKRETWWIDAEKASDLKICNEVARTRSLKNF